MQAIMYTKYGSPDVLELTAVEKPTPKDNEILVKIHATTVTSADARLRSLTVPTGFRLLSRLALGIRKPRHKILGQELAGDVEAVGLNVKGFTVGDRVFGSSGGFGAHAEYITLPDDGVITTLPSNMSYEEAVAVPFGALSSLVYLRDFGNIQAGQKVLINGASGCLGTYGVQLAKYFGAEVTGVCSGANVDLVKSLGADHVIDYTQADFTQNGETYDIIYDTVGTVSFSQCKGSLVPNGRCLLAVAGIPQFLHMVGTSLFGKKKIGAGVATFSTKDLNFIRELIEAGKITAVIDRTYPLEQIVEAHRYVDTGRKKGSVVITVAENS
jgi:NADPH:quinone reductase-like Zn-dependent oxidoreductase